MGKVVDAEGVRKMEQVLQRINSSI